jgi:hypothetical protein
MRREAMLFYTAAGRDIPVARLRCTGEGIRYEMLSASKEIPYDPRKLEETVRFLIDLPVRLYSLRHKTLPQYFSEVTPGSPEHFRLMERTYGSFKVVTTNAA